MSDRGKSKFEDLSPPEQSGGPADRAALPEFALKNPDDSSMLEIGESSAEPDDTEPDDAGPDDAEPDDTEPTHSDSPAQRNPDLLEVESTLEFESPLESPDRGSSLTVDLTQGLAQSFDADDPPLDRFQSEEQIQSSGLDQEEDPDVNVEQLIDDYSTFLFGYAYRLTGIAADAEDLTQQTFMIAHQKLFQLRNPKSAKSWLCAILRSSWLKSIRRKQPKPASDIELVLDDFLEEEKIDDEIDVQAIQNLLNELPDDYRLVLLMFYFEDLSYQEIAKTLNVKIGTVMSRLSRAKARIRRRITDPRPRE